MTTPISDEVRSSTGQRLIGAALLVTFVVFGALKVAYVQSRAMWAVPNSIILVEGNPVSTPAPSYACPWDKSDVALRDRALTHFYASMDKATTSEDAREDARETRKAYIVASSHRVLVPVVGALFCVLNALLLLGRRQTVVFLALSLVLGWGAEALGVHRQLLFGSYCYSEILGPKLLGVPVVIPLFWFMLLYIGYVIANFMTRDTPEGESNPTLTHMVGLSLLGSMIAASYDMVLDPASSSMSLVPGWVWDPAGDYFGVPIENFFGWSLVGFVISLTFRLLRHGVPALAHHRPATTGRMNVFGVRYARLIAFLPVAFYFLLWVEYLHPGKTHPALLVIAWIALGIPAIAAVSNWWRWRPPVEVVNDR